MARRRANTTKLEIIQAASRMFLEKGYSATSIKAIADELDISTGHLTFYFPTKEHLLEVLVDMLCGFQWSMIKRYSDEGQSILMALCLELISMAVICEENEVGKDFYLSAYSHSRTLGIIRKNDAERAKLVFGDYCPDWTEEQFVEAETLVSGVEYATLMTTDDSAPIDVRIEGALHTILTIFQVPEEIRKTNLKKVMEMDYASIGRGILRKFIEYVENANEQALAELLERKQIRSVTHDD